MAPRRSVSVVPPRRRDRRPRRALDSVVRQIVEQFDPERVILFGSHAYGEPGPESDVDLMVVMETPHRQAEQAVRICRAIESPFALDLIVRTPTTLATRLALGDPFIHEVVRCGRVLYARTDR